MTLVPPTDVRASQFGLMSVGESSYPPLFAISTLALDGGSGALNLSYWRATKSEPITMLGCSTMGNGAAATPTLCRMGLYTVAANGDISLVASTPNDTAMFNSTYAKVEKALSATYQKVSGQLYATGIIVVSGAALPTFLGNGCPPQITGSTGLGFTWKQKATGYTDLPSSVAAASLSNGLTGPILMWCR